MDFDKDYYAILGVLPTAETVVIRAAYKAMLKVYHPDKFKGSKAEAHTKTVELNEAHSILSNQISRSEYDLFRGNIKDKTYTYKESKQPKDDYQSESYALEKDWAIAIKYQPELIRITDDLFKISPKLAFTYKAVIIESQEFTNKTGIANKMEREYLSLYFGTNTKIQGFAKTLITGNNKDAARELNKAITVLGKGVEADSIIEQIKSEFNLHSKADSIIEQIMSKFNLYSKTNPHDIPEPSHTLVNIVIVTLALILPAYFIILLMLS